jgi:hypothetical protein
MWMRIGRKGTALALACAAARDRGNCLGAGVGEERLNDSPRHGEWAEYKSGERTLRAFVVYPERKEKAPS